MVPLYFYLTIEQAELYSLVLTSVGIGNRTIASEQGYRIEVPPAMAEKAMEAIGRYHEENYVTVEKATQIGRYRPTPAQLSGVFIALLLLTVHLAVVTSSAPKDYIDVFGVDSIRISRGEIHRCVSALFLHADAVHLAGNMVGIILFGGTVCSVAGTGVGWLAILICGFLGNWMNASAHDIRHLSIGASTSVFGAVGLLSALQAVKAKRTGKGWKRVGLALGGGFGLLAFLGTSTRSDLGAHLFGFVAGGLMGAAFGIWVEREQGPVVQWGCGAAAVMLAVVSWVLGSVR